MAVDVRDEVDVSVPTDLFPLPLTAFEKYMFKDDCPTYPMGFVIKISLSGQLHKDSFVAALSRAVRRHPLLGAIVEKSLMRLAWVPSQQDPALNWTEDSDTQISESTGYINLREHPGLITTVRTSNEDSQVSFLFHHATVDGVGAMHFIGDLLAIYGQATTAPGEQQPELSAVNPAILSQRGELYGEGIQMEHSLRNNLSHLYNFVRYYPAGIASSDPKTSSSLRPFVTRTLDRKQLMYVKKLSSKLFSTPNDVYVANLLQTIKAWNSLNNRDSSRECYRLSIPTSLRTPIHDECPAANMVSFVILNQLNNTINDPDELIQSIHERAVQIITTTEGRLFTRLLGPINNVPGLMSFLLSLPMRFSTGTLANVGDVKRQLKCHFPMKRGKCVAGSVTLEGLFGAAPIRKGTSAGISLGTYAGKLLINFNCDPRCFTAEEAEQFADLFVSLLLQNYDTE